MVFDVAMVTLSDDTSYKEVHKYYHGRWMSSSIGRNPTFSCDEILSWMIEIWMENHLVKDINYITINLKCPQKIYKD